MPNEACKCSANVFSVCLYKCVHAHRRISASLPNALPPGKFSVSSEYESVIYVCVCVRMSVYVTCFRSNFLWAMSHSLLG